MQEQGKRPAARADEGEALRRDAARIDELLSELQAMTGPPAWQRVEELVQRIVRLYGTGLERLLDHLWAAGGAPDPEVEERLASDEAVASLLLLHGLHPRSLEERIRRAIEKVRSRVGAATAPGGPEVTIVEARPERVVLRVRGAGGGPVAPALAGALRAALETAAPEVERVEIDGEAIRSAAEPAAGPLVTIDLERSRRNKP